MIPRPSALTSVATAVAVAALVALVAVAPAGSAPPSTSTATSTPIAERPAMTTSLISSAPAVPTGGAFGYTAQVRLKDRASYLQTVFEVFRPSGQLLFKRTRIINNAGPGVERFSFERALTDVLTLDPDEYPVRLTATANVNGTTVSSETSQTLRVYDRAGPRVKTALVVRISGRPMAAPDGRFVLDPATASGARAAVASISSRILTDPKARITLAIPPVLLVEWRRISGGYTRTDGTTARPTDPVPAAYNATLSDLRAAIDTGRLELVTLGYADPNLTDLAQHGLAADVGPQYDAGISGVFASLEVTPSPGTVPAGACVPANELTLLAEKGVRYVVVDTDCVRDGKSRPASGVYPVKGGKLLALAFDEAVTESLAKGDTSHALDHAFSRLVSSPKKPLVLALEIDSDEPTTTDLVGPALSAIEAQPWIQLEKAGSLKAPSGAAKVRLLAGPSTKGAPKGFWTTVSKARAYADAYYAAVGASDPTATTANAQSLVAESSSWADGNPAWSDAARGKEFAQTSLATTKAVLDRVSVNAESITLSGTRGDLPITIVNSSDKTLNVLVTVTSSGGVHVGGDTSIPTTLRPQETYLEVPVDMQTSLSGKLTIEVTADGLVLAKRNVNVQASYLDRLALGGAVVLGMLVMLVFIVRRSRAAERHDGESRSGAGYTDDADDDIHPSSR
ncbi:MAG: hypothetical protein HGB10_08235 [Coriobacteriia bacterium]|nr:hypothetical protein [Coriobacteriia bacterium]